MEYFVVYVVGQNLCFLLVVGYCEYDVEYFQNGDCDCCLNYYDGVYDLWYFDFEEDGKWFGVVDDCGFYGFFGNVMQSC